MLIVGGGHGGAQAAIALRAGGFGGTLAIVGDEPHPPYERPPLSKAYLAGERGFDRLLIRPHAFWAERDVSLLLGRCVVAIDPHVHTVALEGGGALGYGTLIWAAGGAPRRLACPGHGCGGVHYVRARADVDAIVGELGGVRHVVVVGGGYIGLEAAAVLTKLGRRVTLIESQDRLLARVAGPALSHFFAAEHRAHGVDVRLCATVAAIAGDGRATGVVLADGEAIAADMIIVGIGIVPSVGPLLAAGAAGGNGVLVDAFARTTLPRVYAIGDCAAHPNPFAPDLGPIRLESVQNANDMATTAARAIMGDSRPYATVPWFWSDQYDLKLQTVGLSIAHDAAIVRGDPAKRAFSVAYLRQGRLIALDCVNAVRDYAQGRALVQAGARPDPARLADASVPLKSLMEEAA